MITHNIIVLYDGTNASIPSGWSRETALDGLFPKGWGSQAVNLTGGSSSHSHTSPTHTHTMNNHAHSITMNGSHSDGSGYEDQGDGDNSHGINDNHTHNGTFTSNSVTGHLSTAITYQADTNNSLPPYYNVIFIKSLGYHALPQNAMTFWNSSTAPSYLSRCDGTGSTPDLREKYIRGAANSQNAGTTGGTLRHTHNVTHNHGSVSHTHNATTVSSGSNRYLDLASSPKHASGNHQHTFTTTSATLSASTYSATYTTPVNIEPNYKYLDVVKNTTAGAKLEKGMIALWLGAEADVPIGWNVCDGSNGTPDLRNYFIKMPTNAADIGNTGGSNTHTHAASNSHTHTATGSHNHSVGQRIYGGVPGGLTGVGSHHLARADHHHTIQSCTSVTATWQNATISANSSDNQPPYRTVIFIQYEFSLGGAPWFMLI